MLGLWHYWLSIVLLMLGLYAVMTKRNLVKKMMGLNLFQTAVILFYVTMGKVAGGEAPILREGAKSSDYSNPLPHVLMLTAIVVGIATTALGLSLVVRVKEAYGTIEEDEIDALDREDS
jgi:multicomponent Na+:H+ antiporter subunit C